MANDTAGTGAATPAARSMSNPVYQGFRALHVGFVVAPIIAGLDKFLMLLAEWETYLWSGVPEILGIAAPTFMKIVGAVEVLAGILVAVKPRIGGYVVSAWLLGIIVNLMLLGDYWDIALRDLGLAIGAFALARLATAFD